MIVEYVLLLTILSSLVLSMFSAGNGSFHQAFKNSGPRLGARVEKLIRTGEKFESSSRGGWTVRR